MHDWREQSLDGEWSVNYVREEEWREKEKPRRMQELDGYGESVPGSVPGNFELDLERNGVLPEIFKSTNVLLTQKYEGYHVYYSRRFSCSPKEGTVPVLYFEGLDTIAEIYLDGELLGRAENMFIPHSFYPKDLREGEHELIVHFYPVCVEARKNPVYAGSIAVGKYNYASLSVRKAAHMFGWDIMPRIVSCGIFRPVRLIFQEPEYFRQTYMMTTQIDVWNQRARLLLFYDIEVLSSDLSEYEIWVNGVCGDSTFGGCQRVWDSAGRLWFDVEKARFWNPKGYGEPNLYQVSVELRRRGQTVDRVSFTMGIRTVKLIRTGTTDETFSGKFHFEVNGKKIFVQGTNFVPIDAFHSRDRKRLPQVLELLDDIGCNAVRLWGGNLYEDDLFYDFCDRAGILIWQDFMMACGAYPNEDEFGKTIAQEVRTVVRRLRQHPSIIMWAGDNENDVFSYFEPFPFDPNRNRITREFIPRALEFEDPSRPYLPSSPYVDRESAGKPMEYLTENHLWGPRDYFRSPFYVGSLCNFASEIGYHGCVSITSMKEFLEPEEMWPWKDNPAWTVHAACPEAGPEGEWSKRIPLMANQIKELFGCIPDELEKFAMASQISQAEAFKFFIELFRLNRFKRTGIIWWNLIDGWPQFSDAVVDYYFRKKLAYYYIRQVQRPVLLAFAEPKDWEISLQGVNDTEDEAVLRWKVKEYEGHSSKEAASGTAVLDHEVRTLWKTEFSHGEKKIYLIEWEWKGETYKNHYLCGQPPFDLSFYEEFVKDVYGLECWK